MNGLDISRKSRRWPFSTRATPKKAKVFWGRRSPHRAAADQFHNPPSGFTTLEVLAATAVLAAGLAGVAPLAVRHTRLLTESRWERIALEELVNQAERLAALPARDRQAAVDSLAPSAFAVTRLPDPVLAVERGASPFGERLVLSLRWGSAGRRDHPLRLAVWPAVEAVP